ncbi:hypothetical protein HPB50_011977 [Hyalomma asiaticum]|uniref:Uncharacterized protein n=1 Tax=Hyalomma asiaticum TaxID=266040 RepID=A0ACB7T243_HYAAI|nr:hypothetical protein HPB50_011977 [Hyalomma asiaticum]
MTQYPGRVAKTRLCRRRFEEAELSDSSPFGLATTVIDATSPRDLAQSLPSKRCGSEKIPAEPRLSQKSGQIGNFWEEGARCRLDGISATLEMHAGPFHASICCAVRSSFGDCDQMTRLRREELATQNVNVGVGQRIQIQFANAKPLQNINVEKRIPHFEDAKQVRYESVEKREAACKRRQAAPDAARERIIVRMLCILTIPIGEKYELMNTFLLVSTTTTGSSSVRRSPPQYVYIFVDWYDPVREEAVTGKDLNSNLHCSGKIFKLGERLMQVASTTADCLMQSAATLAVRLTQSTAIPHAPARQTLSPTGRIPASNQRRVLIGGFNWLMQGVQKGAIKGASRGRSDERERLKKSRVVIAPQCEPNKLSAPVPKM